MIKMLKYGYFFLISLIALTALYSFRVWIAPDYLPIELSIGRTLVSINADGLTLGIGVLILCSFLLGKIIGLVIALPKCLRTLFARYKTFTHRKTLERLTLAYTLGDSELLRKFNLKPICIEACSGTELVALAEASAETKNKTMIEKIQNTLLQNGSLERQVLGLWTSYRLGSSEPLQDRLKQVEYLEKIIVKSPKLAKPYRELLRSYCQHLDWKKALSTLDRMQQNKLIDSDDWKRKKAVLIIALIRSDLRGDPESSRLMIDQALRLDPTLIPAMCMKSEHLAETVSTQSAMRYIEHIWKRQQHYELGQLYLKMGSPYEPKIRFQRATKLHALAPNALASIHLLTQVALDNDELIFAQEALAPLLEQPTPTRTTYLLKARLEQLRHPDRQDVAFNWIVKALRSAPDPCWMIGTTRLDHWEPIDTRTGEIGCCEWKQPSDSIANTTNSDELQLILNGQCA